MIFPRYKDRWFECHICGFSYPYDRARRQKTSQGSKLVDEKCWDNLTVADYRERWGAMPTEGNRDIAEQPVVGQGQAEDLYETQDVLGGAGIGGAGSGTGGLDTSAPVTTLPTADTLTWRSGYWRSGAWHHG